MRKSVSAGAKGLNSRRVDFNATVHGRLGLNLDVTRRELLSRRSVFSPQPSSISDDSLTDEETNEIDILYNDYLVCHAIDVNKLIRNREKSISTQVSSLAVMKDTTESKLQKYQSRNRDIQELAKIDSVVRKELSELNDILDSNENKITNILENIYISLQNFNSLEVNNLVIPEKSNDFQILQESLNRCRDTLQLIIDPISESKLQMNISKNLGDFEEAVELTNSLLKSVCEQNNQQSQYHSLKLLMILLKKICNQLSNQGQSIN